MKLFVTLMLLYTSANFCMYSNTPEIEKVYALYKAVQSDDIEKATELIKTGACPTVIAPGDVYTATHYAAEKNNVTMINLFQSATGFNDIDTLSAYGTTALGTAAFKNNVQAAEALVQAGANPNGGVPNNKPIILAASAGNVEVLKFLIGLRNFHNKPAIDINKGDNGKYTPLYYAADNGHLAAVQLLAEQPNIHINIKGFNGETPLAAAKRKGHTNVVHYLEHQKQHKFCRDCQ